MEKENRKFIKAYNDSLSKMALKVTGLTGREYRVLIYLFSLLANKNKLLFISQTQIAEDLKMNKSDVSRIFKKLTAMNIIVNQGKHLYLNSDICSFGAETNLDVKKPNWGKSKVKPKKVQTVKVAEKTEKLKSLDDFYKELEADEDKTTKIMVEELVA